MYHVCENLRVGLWLSSIKQEQIVQAYQLSVKYIDTAVLPTINMPIKLGEEKIYHKIK